MVLTDVEKEFGRRFRDDCNAWLGALNETSPPTYDVPFFLGVYRHLCTARGSRSTGMELKERYVPSLEDARKNMPAGRFGFIYRDGHCRACGQTARSRIGRIVDGWERPPLTGRVARS